MRVYELGFTAAAALSLLGAACGDDGPAACEDVSGHGCTWLGVAGPEPGYNGDGRHRLDTQIYWSMDAAFAPDGRVWFIDWNNHLVRRVEADDTVTTIVGDPLLFPGDGTGDDREYSEEGAPGRDVKLNHPTDFSFLPDGSLLLMAWHNHKLRHIDPATGNVTIVCGGGQGFSGDGGPATDALFRLPKSVVVGPDGSMYLADQGNFRVRKIGPDGVVDTIAGNGTVGFSGDGAAATDAQLGWEFNSNPQPSGGLALSPDGETLYIADTLNHRIRAVALATGVITTVAGTGVQGFDDGGGDALAAQFAEPRDMEFGPDGDLYIADTDNHVIRALDVEAGTIRTVVGTGGVAGLEPEDGVPATELLLERPFGLEFDPAGNLFVMDTFNNRIVKVAK